MHNTLRSLQVHWDCFINARRRMSRSDPRKLLIRISIIFVLSAVHETRALTSVFLRFSLPFRYSVLVILLNPNAIEHCIIMGSLALPMIFFF